MTTTEITTPKHYQAITLRAEHIQRQVVSQLDDRLLEVCAALDNGSDLIGRFNKLTETVSQERRMRLETGLETVRCALRDAGVSLQLLTFGHLNASMSLLRQSAESLCLAYLVKHEPTLLLLGRRIEVGAASRALHRHHDLGPDQIIADRLYMLIDRLKESMAADRRGALGAHFDRSRMPEYYLQLENIKRICDQIVSCLKELLLVETVK
jgi:hypothetical protein